MKPINKHVVAELVTYWPPIPVQVCLSWTETDPLAVSFAFRAGRKGWVTWHLALELLRDALLLGEEVGEGDVRMRFPTTGVLLLVLDSPSGRASFEFEMADLEEFMERVDLVRPPWAALDEDELDAWLDAITRKGNAA